MKLQDLIRQDSLPPSQDAVLNVLATASWVSNVVAHALAPYGVTPAQYNVLRILRGVYPGRHTCSEVGARLVERTPDVTRLLDRLERERLVERRRSTEDRRVVEVGITEQGLALLSDLDGPAEAAVAEVARHLAEDELRNVSALLEKMRTDQR